MQAFSQLSGRNKIIIGAVLLAVVVGIVSLIHHFQLKAAEDALRAELKAKGLIVELPQALPPVPSAEEDGTEIFRRVAVLLAVDKTLLSTDSVYAMRPVAAGKAMAASQQPVVHWDEGTNSWESLAGALAQNEAAMDTLLKMTGHPALDFHIQYETDMDDAKFTNLCLVQLKSSARYLSEAAMLDLHNGNTAAATSKVRAMLALAGAMRSERFWLSELVRMTMVNMAQSATWEILQATNVNRQQLRFLQAAWQPVDLLPSYRDTLLMERVTDDITLSRWRASDAELDKFFVIQDRARKVMGYDNEDERLADRLANTFKVFWWRYWWSYTDELRSLHGYEMVMEALQQAGTNENYLVVYQEEQRRLNAQGLLQTGNEVENILAGKPRDMHHLLSESIPSLAMGFHKIMLYETGDRVVLAAIALKGFQLEQGHYPEQLSELVPEFMASVPNDPMDGKPLRYRRNADGTYLLYSVGENGTDEGGDPGPPTLSPGYTSYYWQNKKATDWVWPQAATAAEVEKYFADEKKDASK